MGKSSYTFNNDPPPSDKKRKTGENAFSNGAYTFEKSTKGDFNNSFGKEKDLNGKTIEMGDIEYKEKPKESKKQPEKSPDVGLFQMFRFADAIDKVLIIVGTLAAIINGLCYPANFFVYGEVVTGFIYFDQIPDNLTVAYNLSLPFNVDDYTDVYGNTRGYALCFCLIGIACLVSSTIQYTCWDITMERQMLKVRSSLFKSIVHQDMGWFDQHDAGELGTSFTESMSHIELGIGREIGTFIQWIATCLGAYVLALVKGWKLTLACLTFAPLIIIVGGLLVKWIKNLSITEGRAYAQAGSVVTEVLTAIKTVLSFNGQEKETERYNRFLDAAKSMGVKKGLAMGLGLGLIWFFLFGLLATAFGYGVRLMNDREPGFEPGNVLLIFFGVMIGSISLAHAAPILETIANGRAAAGKVFAIIDTKPVIDSSSSIGIKPKGIHGSVELRNVRFTYPTRAEVEVLKDVSINMRTGQTVAIVGHSGCGKSTIVQLIERFYDVTAGQILLDGVDIRELNVEWLRNQIGLVSQEPVLFATSIRENIQFGRMDITEKELLDAAKNANIHDFIQLLPEGYDTMVGQRGTQLSGGQKQRIAIARALVRNPKILLLDEATSALDNESEAVVQKALENAQKGRTTIVIAHRLSTIQTADLIVAMDDGKVIESGTHADLMTRNGLYADLVRNQAQHSSEDEVIEELEHDFTGDKGSMDIHHSQHKFSIMSNNKQKDADEDEEKEAEENGKKTDVSLKRLLRMNASEWHYILGGCLCSAVNGAMQPSLAFLISEYLKVFAKPEDERLDFSLIMTGVIMGIALVNTTIRVFQNIFFALSGELLTTRLRRLTFKSFLKQDMEFFDDPKHQVSILATRLSSDATQVHGATGGKIGYLMESSAVMICSLLIAFISSWRLSLVVVALLPLMIASGILHGKVILGFAKINKALLEKASHICSETIDNAKLVASLSREDTFKDKYIGIISVVSRKSLRRCILTSILLGFSNSVLFFGYGAALTYGSYLMQEDLVAYYLVVRVFSSIIFGGQHIGRMSINSGDLNKAKLAASRLFCFIDRVPKIDSGKDDGLKQVQLQGNISFNNVDFNYPFRTDVQVLNHLSLEAKAGETIALVGASGCGKSTTVSLIERFYDPVDGIVMIDGKDTKSFNLRWLRSQIGFVQQEPVLFDCSIAENIAYGANDRKVEMQEIIAAARSANIHSFIDALPNGYETNVGNKGTQLSGGQKQRIAIARAMISNPRILLLDEATSALDSKSEQIVQEALDVAQKGRTCIVIAHRLSTIQNADKIAIIHKGSVVEMGSHSELIAAKGIYYKFLNLHNSKGKTK